MPFPPVVLCAQFGLRYWVDQLATYAKGNVYLGDEAEHGIREACGRYTLRSGSQVGVHPCMPHDAADPPPTLPMPSPSAIYDTLCAPWLGHQIFLLVNRHAATEAEYFVGFAHVQRRVWRKRARPYMTLESYLLAPAYRAHAQRPAVQLLSACFAYAAQHDVRFVSAELHSSNYASFYRLIRAAIQSLYRYGVVVHKAGIISLFG